MLVMPMIVYYMLIYLFHLKKHVRVNSAAAALKNLGTNKPLPFLVGSKKHEGPSGRVSSGLVACQVDVLAIINEELICVLPCWITVLSTLRDHL